MSQWSKSKYVGPKDNLGLWEQGKGKFTFPNGVIYEGQMDKGEFHGEGTLIYPNGVSTQFYPFLTCNFYRVATSPSGTEANLNPASTSSTMTSCSKTRTGTTAQYKTDVSTPNRKWTL